MDSNIEPLQSLSAPRLTRSAINTANFRSNSVGLLILVGCCLTVFSITGCSNSAGHAARAESGAEQSNSSGSVDPNSPVSSEQDGGGVPGVSSGSSPGWSGPGSPSDPSSSDSAGAGISTSDPSTGNSGSGIPNSGNSSSGDTVVSSGPIGEQHEWTQEEMLLARPMPMSQEERDFAFKNKAPESIRTWTLGEFQDYTKTPMGRTQMLQEGRRWVSIRTNLKEQLALGQEFLVGGGKPKAKKNKAVSKNGQSPEQSNEVIPDFLIDEGVFEGAENATTFDHLKECRQDITDLCRAIDGVKKTASKRGRLEAIEQYMSSQ
ncbi:MAG: hypothetical protein WCT03_06885 [Candidatus Obscuribacterales bacterium]